MNPERLDAIIDELRGTAKSLEEVLEDGEELTIADHITLDMEIFQCERCGWWCEQSEMSEDEDWVCDDCT